MASIKSSAPHAGTSCLASSALGPRAIQQPRTDLPVAVWQGQTTPPTFGRVTGVNTKVSIADLDGFVKISRLRWLDQRIPLLHGQIYFAYRCSRAARSCVFRVLPSYLTPRCPWRRAEPRIDFHRGFTFHSAHGPPFCFCNLRAAAWLVTVPTGFRGSVFSRRSQPLAGFLRCRDAGAVFDVPS